MGKKAVLLFSVLLFAGLVFGLTGISGQEETGKILSAGSLAGEVRQAEKLLAGLPGTLDTEELRLCFRGEELACDRKTNVWYLPSDMESDAWEAGTFTDFGGTVRILPLLDYTTLDKQSVIAEGQQIPFLAWKESEETCALVYVVFTGLPVVRIETDADLDVDTVFAGSVVFYEPCSKPEWTVSSAFQAHERGQTTRAYPKKGYRLNLISVTPTGAVNENPEPVLGMRKSDTWIFYAIYSDGTKIRDRFNIELWNGFGAENTPYQAHFGTHMEYAELVVNGEYRGLYGILEPVDSRQLSMSEQEYLYKRTVGRELLSGTFDETGPEDYLTTLGMEIKGKDGYGSRADWRCFRDFVQMCEEEDEVFLREAEKLLYTANAADMWLYLQMIYGEDNIYKNMFFAFKKEQDGYRLYLVPWDVDLTWGNVYTDQEEELYVTGAPERAENYLEWPFMDRVLALDVGKIRSVVSDRWKELRQSALSDVHMEELFQRYRHQVQDSGAFQRDALRWPDSHHDGDYERMHDFMVTRMNYLDKMIENIDGCK
ncbi:MAG: CotH kinase family protein [Lachnospiraceae bacterium]|nr:CotH kinase family protein [Lachnospiraceae bacterium]